MRRSLVSLAGAVGALALAGSARAADEQAPQAASNGVVDLSTVDEVRQLCLATRPTSRVYFTGEPTDQAKSKQEYIAARRTAMKQLYRVSIPASGFKLGEYKPKDSVLLLDLQRPPRTLYGALTLAVPSSSPAKFQMNQDKAKEAQNAVRAGTATLVSYFELSDEQGAVCNGSAAAGVYTASVRPVLFELRDGMGQSLGRAEMDLADQHRSQLGLPSGTPAVAFGAVEGEGVDANAIAKRLAPTTDSLKACYDERVKLRPDASGTAVLGVAVLADGRVESVSFVADALRDEPLRKCIEDNMKSLKFNGIAGLPALFRVSVDFKLVRSK